MKASFLAVFVIASGLLMSFEVGAREWVSTDGNSLEADFVSATETSVTILRTLDGKEFSLPLERLSEADRKWVAENKDKEPDPEPITGEYAKLITGSWELAEFEGLPFAIYASAKLDASKKYPLVLGLHGKSPNNENGKQKGVLRAFEKPDAYEANPAILVAPLCYQPFGITGSGWGDEPGVKAIALVEELAENLPVDEDRIYCLGNSMGGGGTSSLICNEPKLFAAGIVICGWPASGADSVFKKVPVWAFHGSADTTVSPASMRALAENLKREDNFKYTEFEGAGHGISGQVWETEGVMEWLFSKTR